MNSVYLRTLLTKTCRCGLTSRSLSQPVSRGAQSGKTTRTLSFMSKIPFFGNEEEVPKMVDDRSEEW